MQVIDRMPAAEPTESSGVSLSGEARAHLYSAILDHITDAVAIIDPSGLYLEQNPAHAALIGYSDEELRGQTPALHLGHEAAGKIMAHLRAEGAYRGEVESRTKLGEIKIVELSAFAVRDSHGRPLCYVGTKRDMTGRRRIEEALVDVRGALEREQQEKQSHEAARAALEESERRQRFLLEKIPAVLWATDCQLRFTLSTGSGLKQLGLRPNQVVGMTFMEYFQIEDPEALPVTGMLRALAGETVSFQQDWQGITYESLVEPLYNGDGRIIGTIGLSRDITERRRVEDALRVQGLELSTLFDNAPEVIARYDREGRIIRVNRAIEEATGLPPAAVLGKTFRELGAPTNVADLWQRSLETTVATRKEQDVEFELPSPRGPRWYQSRMIPEWGRQGEIETVLVLSRDITERKQAEQALRESEAQFSKAFHASPHSIGITDLETGRCIDVNDTCLNLFGYRREQVIGETTLNLGIWPNPEDRKRLIDTLLEGKAVRNMEMSFVVKSGEKKQILVSSDMIVLNGKRHLLTVGADITERKRMEEALRESEERLALAAEGSSDALWDGRCLPGKHWSDPDNPIWWSPRIREMLALENNEPFNTLGQWAARVHPDDLGFVMEALTAHVEQRLPFDREYRIRTSRGDYRWLRGRGQGMWDELGRPYRMAGSCQDITDRKQAEEALRESEEQFRMMFDDAGIGMCRVDMTGRFLRVNGAFSALVGYSQEELATLRFKDLTHPDDVDRNLALFDQAKAGEIAHYALDKRYCRKDGRVVWTSLVGSVGYDREGRPAYVLAQLQDITERKRAEDALRHSQDKLNQALHASNTGLWEWNTRSGEVSYSNEWKRQLGYDEGELADTFETWESRLHPDDQQRTRDYVRSYLAAPASSYQQEFRLRHKDGSYRWIAARASFVVEPDGQQIRLLGSHTDITDRKLAEEALRANEGRLRAAFDNAAIGMVMGSHVHGNGIDEVNHAFCAMLGYSERELKTLGMNGITHSEDVATSQAFIKRLVAREIDSGTIEKRYVKKDGTMVWALTSLSSIRDREGNYVELLALVQDITERKRTEEALRESEDRYRRLVDLSPSGIFVYCEGKTVYVNQAACRIMKTERPKDLLNRSAFEFMHPDCLAEVKDNARALLEGGEPVRRAERKYVAFDGQVVDVLVEAGPISWKGKPAILGIFSDITDRVQAEQARRRNHAVLSAIMDGSIDIVYVKDLDGRYVHINQTGARALGMSIEEVIGRTDHQLWSADLAASCSAADQRVLATGELVTTEETSTANGTATVFLTTKVPYRDPEGRIIGVIGVSRDITERKRTEEALRLSEGRYRMLVDGLRDVVYLLAPEGLILSLNPAFEARTGWLREEWIGRPFLDLVHPDDREGAVLGLKRALAGVKDTRTELRIRTKNGDWIIVEGAGGPYEEHGRVCGVLGVARDITARVKAERALSKTQADLRRITDAIPGFVYQYRVGPDGAQSFPFASRGTKDLLGCDAAELEADAMVGWRTVVPEDVPAIQSTIAVSAANLTPWTHEFRVRSSDGVVKWIRGSSLPERQEDGATVWYGLFTDVTAPREAEQQLRLTQFAMDHAADAILWAGPDRRLVYANEEACRSLGYSKREMLQLSISDIAPQHDPIRFEQRLALLKQGQTDQYQSFHRAKDGREFPVEVSIRYLEHNGVGYTCGIARDITERKQFEQQLRHADRLATLGTITAGVAHELNNPLFVISGHLHLIERKLVRRQLKALRKELMAAQDAAERATNIVSQFLNTAHGSVDMRVPCDLAEIMEQVLVLMRNEFRARHIHVERSVALAVPSVSADPQALTQVFLNLFTNACQALESASGTGLISVELRATEFQGLVAVECLIRDNGPGIAPDLLPRIFDPFFTTKPVGEGTGLGLAICHRIVSELCGTLTCESRIGEGATFTMRLPASGSSASRLSLRQSTRRRKG